MKKRIMSGILVLFLVCANLLPVSGAAGYFAEDGFASYWLEQKPSASKAVLRTARPLRYEVCRGDTLWSLAGRWGVEPGFLAAANGIRDGAVLYPGQLLVIPAASGITHRVAPGDTLWSLARRYQVSVVRLIAYNQITDPDTLTVGMELIIPDAAKNGAVVAQASTDEQHYATRGGNQKFTWPLDGRITSYFGARESGNHSGIDIAGNYGDPIRAARSGQVVYTGWRPYYGNTVVLDHGEGQETWYGHTENILVSAGDFVARGESIALVGSSGRSTGPHLHFEIRKNNQVVDPIHYLNK